MNNPLDHLDKLRIFVTVVDQEKISSSAALLGLTQPSITRAIQKLEDAFETKLLIRGRYGVKLTKSGEILYRSASRLLHELSDVKTQMKESHDQFAGNLIVGSYESLAEYLWPDFLVALHKTLPNLIVSVHTGNGRDVFRLLTEGQIDLLVDAETRMSELTTSWALYSDRFGFFSAPSKKGRVLNQAEAKSETLLYVPNAQDEAGIAIEHHIKRQDYSFRQEGVFDSFATVKRLAIRGFGIAVLPLRLAEEDLKARRLTPVSVNGFSAHGFGQHTIYATSAAQRARDPRVRKLVSLLKQHFA